ncbi:MAG TPA: tetratricopeptide repeat protein [Chthoniobacteraceae bacterium]|jgi:hypothetical protein|nr:tetratricopeptide repeat protein [Chthoniobacteraceae bacterium]
MKRSLLAVLCFAACHTTPAWACMNDYNPNSAALVRSHALMTQLGEHHETEAWPVRRDRLRKLLAAGGDYTVKNDLATTLAHTGEATESVRLLEEIEVEKPGLYRTASNLGTAYELAGDDQKALEWIRRGIERDPTSHGGTEWLHVRILEAKLALAADVQWLGSHSVLGVREEAGAVELSVTGNRGEPLSADQVKAALLYQLHERLQFVAPPDAIVGDLLLVLGQLVAQEPLGIGGAVEIYRLAGHYLDGLANVAPLASTAELQLLQATLMQRRGRQETFLARSAPVIVTCALGFIVCGLAIALKRLIQRRLASG